MTEDEWITAARGYVEYQHYVASLVAARRADPRDDLLSDLVRLSDDADVRMDRAEMFGQIAALISAGHETSISLIAFCVFYLLSDRRQWEALCADPRLAAAAAKEGMRFESPAVSTWRVAREDTELSGVAVPAGGKVLVLIASANRDRSICEPADTFDIAHKTDVPNLGFGPVAVRAGAPAAFLRDDRVLPGRPFGRAPRTPATASPPTTRRAAATSPRQAARAAAPCP